MFYQINHKDKTSQKLTLKKDFGYNKIFESSFYDADGYYIASRCYEIETNEDEIKNALESANDNGSIIKQITDSGKIIDFKKIVL